MSKILVIGAAWVGDAVLSQSLFSALRARDTAAEIHVLAPAWTHGVLQRMPEPGRVLHNPFGHGELSLGARRKLGQQLGTAQYDQAIVLPNSFKSALVPWFAGIPQRTGYVGELRQLLLNDSRILNRAALPLMVERFAALAQPPGGIPGQSFNPPRLIPDPDNQAKVMHQLGLTGELPVAVFCPGAEFGPAKRWPAHHFADLARQLTAQGFQIWILGSGSDQPIGAAIAASVQGPVHNLCGNTTLSDAVDLMAVAARVISNDSGLMHVAAALNRPLVALFGSSSPEFTPPLSDNAHVLRLGLPCSPCFKRECPLHHLNCLEHLTPEQVMACWPPA